MLSNQFAAVLVSLLVPAVPCLGDELPAAGDFRGQWNVTGEQQRMDFIDGREITLTRYRGEVNIVESDGLPRAFFAQCLSFGDTGGTGSARCQWIDSQDERIYLELTSRVVESKSYVQGRLVGGTGRYAGISGAFELEAWVYTASNEEEREVTAYTDNLRGNWSFND